MLAIQKQGSSAKACIPNILPCKIHHNGQVNASQRHWDPQTNDNGEQIAYFRGRKLIGRSVVLPQGYQGVVVQKTDSVLPVLPSEEDEEAEEDNDAFATEVKLLHQAASFDRFTVWGHESKPTDIEDSHIKGLQEWIQLAQAMNSFDDETT